MTRKDWQKVYDAIKQLRAGYPADVMLHGRAYRLEPFTFADQYRSGYCQTVLCKHGKGRRQKIGIAEISWKDAGPNPRIHNDSETPAFIPHKHIYGVVVRDLE